MNNALAPHKERVERAITDLLEHLTATSILVQTEANEPYKLVNVSAPQHGRNFDDKGVWNGNKLLGAIYYIDADTDPRVTIVAYPSICGVSGHIYNFRIFMNGTKRT